MSAKRKPPLPPFLKTLLTPMTIGLTALAAAVSMMFKRWADEAVEENEIVGKLPTLFKNMSDALMTAPLVRRSGAAKLSEQQRVNIAKAAAQS
jgi:hypothetical protein